MFTYYMYNLEVHTGDIVRELITHTLLPLPHPPPPQYQLPNKTSIRNEASNTPVSEQQAGWHQQSSLYRDVPPADEDSAPRSGSSHQHHCIDTQLFLHSHTRPSWPTLQQPTIQSHVTIVTPFISQITLKASTKLILNVSEAINSAIIIKSFHLIQIPKVYLLLLHSV